MILSCKYGRLFFGILGLILLNSGMSRSSPLQNTENASQYFENRLNFEMSPHELKTLLEADEPQEFVILDVRAVEDYTQGHIPGAINLPHTQYSSFKGPETEFPTLKKSVLHLVVCYGGDCNLSHAAAQKLASLGYPVKKMIGGFSHWANLGYPVEAS